MVKYVSKFFLEILPSVIATVVGAYIVNHYINPRNGTETPKAAVYSTASPASKTASDATPKDSAAKAAGSSTQVAKTQPSDETSSEKPAEVAKETAKEASKHLTLRERLLARPTKPAASEKALSEKALAEKPMPESTSAAPAQTPEEHRDAAELARAAIERLRNSDQASRQAERPSQDPALVTARQQPQQSYEMPRTTVVPPPVVQPVTIVEPLPPPVNVTAAIGERAPVGGQSNEGGIRKGETAPVPPADIPPPAALNIQPITPAQKPSVADDVLTAARSVIHAVVPQ